MTLLELDRDLAASAARWIRKDWKWLDLGLSSNPPARSALLALARKRSERVRIFTDDAGTPCGIVGLTEVNARAKTARLWFVLGDKQQAARGLTSHAVKLLLSEGFDELELCVVHAAAVATNTPALRVLEKVGMRPTGRQRKAHVIDGRRHDRLVYDLLHTEHRRWPVFRVQAAPSRAMRFYRVKCRAQAISRVPAGHPRNRMPS